MDYRKVIKTALQGYDEQSISMEKELSDVKFELRSAVDLLRIREEQISNLESAVEDLSNNLLKLENDKKMSDEMKMNEFRLAIKEKDEQIEKQSQSFSKQLQDVRENNMISLQNILKESTRHIDHLENQLSEMRLAEQSQKEEIKKLKLEVSDKERELKNNGEEISKKEREIKEIRQELLESRVSRNNILQKFKQTEATAKSLQDQHTFLQDDNKRVKCEMVERIRSLEVLLEAMVNRNRESQTQVMGLMKIIGSVSEDCSLMKTSLRRVSGEAFAESISIGVQVKLNFDDICFEDTIITLKRKVTQLTQQEIEQNRQLQQTVNRLEEIEEENGRLRETIKYIRRVKMENLKERQEEEDVRRIQRIEEGIVRLRSQLGVQGCQEGLPHLLNDIRGELAELKGKSWYKVVRHSGTVATDAREVEPERQPTAVISRFDARPVTDRLPNHVPKVEESLAKSKMRNRVKFSGVQGI